MPSFYGIFILLNQWFIGMFGWQERAICKVRHCGGCKMHDDAP
jgi:hypothetical protein